MDRIQSACSRRWPAILLVAALAALPWLVTRQPRPADLLEIPHPDAAAPQSALTDAGNRTTDAPPASFQAAQPVRALRPEHDASRPIRPVAFPYEFDEPAEPRKAPADLPSNGDGADHPAGPEFLAPSFGPPFGPPLKPEGAAVAPPRALDGAASESPQLLSPWAASPLLPEGETAARSEQLEQIARQADRLTRHGFDLAGLRAYFAARAKFVAAMRLLAQGLDTENQTAAHSRALAAGLTALREADDFVPRAAHLEADLDVEAIVRRHATPVLKDAAGAPVTPLMALRCYLTHAQEQLAAAAGQEVAGSVALHALGKLHGTMAAERYNEVKAAEAKAVAFYQAALLVFPNNATAANDLGVLLARGGNYAQARAFLEHGVLLAPQSTIWHNLAVVYRQIGRDDLAPLAAWQAETLRRAEAARGAYAGPGPAVRWVDPTAFTRGGLSSAAGAESRVPLALPVPSTGLHEHARAPLALPVPSTNQAPIQLCQALGPAAPHPVAAIDCSRCYAGGWCRGWECARARHWQAFAQGEYVGHARTEHVSEYRLRVDDQLDLVYRRTREKTPTPYALNVGDEIRIESFTDPELNRDLLIQPDGTITLRLLGQVQATDQTVPQLREKLEELYKEYYKVPAVTVTPLVVNSKLNDLVFSVDARYGQGGLARPARVTPEGTIAVPVLGSVFIQGLTLDELQAELNERYREQIEGIQVIPVLTQRAPRFVYVLGEVRTPGRYELTGPTTVIQAISMAGSWNVGAHLKQVVVFRRGDDWRLMATMVDVGGALHGNEPCPAGEIWLSDSDIVLLPKSPILRANDFIDQVFTRGIYGVFPMSSALNFSKLSTL